jgi:hypothetical protein
MATQRNEKQREPERRTTNSKPIPHIPLPFKEVMKDVLKVKPPKKENLNSKKEECPE